MAKASASRENFEEPKFVEPPELSMLWDDFLIAETESQYIIKCRKCKDRWALAKTSPPHTGNILALMNHAGSH